MLDQIGSHTKPVEPQTMQEPCPCCGYVPQVTNPNTVRFDYWKGTVYNHKTAVLLSPSESDILKILMDSWPVIVERSSLLLGLYGKDYKEKVGKGTVLMVHLSKLRSKIRPLGLSIMNNSGRGWWLAKRD